MEKGVLVLFTDCFSNSLIDGYFGKNFMEINLFVVMIVEV